MRATKFGYVGSVALPFDPSADVEVMWFSVTGRPHTHHRDEVAICTAGRGCVWVGDDCHPVEPGDHVHVPAGASHYMVPDFESGMAMTILYGTVEDEDEVTHWLFSRGIACDPEVDPDAVERTTNIALTTPGEDPPSFGRVTCPTCLVALRVWRVAQGIKR